MADESSTARSREDLANCTSALLTGSMLRPFRVLKADTILFSLRTVNGLAFLFQESQENTLRRRLPKSSPGGLWHRKCRLDGSGDNSWWSAFWPLEKISETGGNPQPLFPLDKGETGNYDPVLLPGGKAVAFLSNVGSGTGGGKISVRSLTTGERHDLIPANASHLRYVSPGYLVYVQVGNLIAAPFDLNKLSLAGPPVTVVEGVLENYGAGAAQYDVSATGTLVYIPGLAHAPLKLVWVDRKGVEQPINAPSHTYVLPRVAPNGQPVAVGIEETDAQIWVYDTKRDALTRLTFQGKSNVDPIWTRDGQRIVYKGAGNRLFWQAADGSGEQQITSSNLGSNNVPGSWSSDGQHMVFTYDVQGGRQIWIYPQKTAKLLRSKQIPLSTKLRLSFHRMAVGSPMLRRNPGARRFTSVRSPARAANGRFPPKAAASPYGIPRATSCFIGAARS